VRFGQFEETLHNLGLVLGFVYFLEQPYLGLGWVLKFITLLVFNRLIYHDLVLVILGDEIRNDGCFFIA
jgi:hypothetical protein